MKTHNTIMIILVILAVLLLFFGPAFNIGRGFGLALLICPLMMLGMMTLMGHNHNKDDRKQ